MKAPGYQNINNIKLMQQNIGCNILAFSDILEDLTSSVTKVKKDEYSFIGEYSIIDQGKEFIAGYYNSNQGISSSGPHIVFGDHTRIFKYVDFPILLGADGTKLLAAKISDVNMKYLYYFFNTLSLPNDGYSRHFKYLKQVVIPLPNIQYQNKIANILDQAQRLIDKRKEQIALLDELVQSVFYDMFGDPVLNKKGWQTDLLENKCNIFRGGSPRPIKDYLGGDIPWIKIGDATNGENIYLYDTKEKIIEEGVKKSRLVPKGSLIFANCGVSLGFARIIKFDGCIHDGWLSFESISNDINKIYLLKLLNLYTDYFRKTAPEGTQPNLNTKIMKDFKIIIPPIDLQVEYVNTILKMEQQKELLNKSLAELETNFHSLMQRAFRGELVVE